MDTILINDQRSEPFFMLPLYLYCFKSLLLSLEGNTYDFNCSFITKDSEILS